MYKLVYAPEIESTNVNYLYKDNKVHVRLSRFGHRYQIISGFEGKLSFLVTFLINDFVAKSMMSKNLIDRASKDKDNKVLKEMIDSFERNSKDYKAVKENISEYMHRDNLTFKIVPFDYKRLKTSLDKIGECYNLYIDNSCSNISGLYLFMLYFNIDSSINSFLFDDCYYIEITRRSVKVNNQKFIKKHAEKENDYVKLW